MILAAIAVLGIFGQQVRPDAKDIAAEAQLVLERAYKREDVVAYCTAYPTSIYTIEIQPPTLGPSVEIIVRCRAFHDWRELKAGK